jgi:hypothetical protein
MSLAVVILLIILVVFGGLAGLVSYLAYLAQTSTTTTSGNTGTTPPNQPVIPFIPSTEFEDYLNRETVKGYTKTGVGIGAVVAYYGAKHVAKKVASRSGSKIATAIAAKVSILSLKGVKIIAKIAAIAPKLGLQIGKVAAGLARITAHAANPLTWGLIVFDIISIGLDFGDAGKYNNLGSNAFYDKLNRELAYNTIGELNKQGIPYPIIAGPFDNINEADFERVFTAEIDKILSVPDNIFLVPLTNAMNNANLTTEKAMETFVDENFETYVDVDALMNQAEKNICATTNGKWSELAPVTINGANNTSITSLPSKGCSWTKTDCVNNWPLNADDDIYKEWDKNLNTCVLAPSAPRVQCDTDGANYDLENRKCVIDQNYCFHKGGDWRPNPKNNNIMDCMIGTGQDVAEFLFGTTVTRDIKRLFASSSRPADCPAGYTNTGLTCYRAPDSIGQDSKNATCTNPEYPVHMGLYCGQKCPDGWRDDGLFCAKPGEYGVGAGYPWEFGDKAFSLDEARQRCARDNPQGCEQDGQIIYPACKPGFKKFGCCVCTPKCEDVGLGEDWGVSCKKKKITTGEGMGCDSEWTLDKNLGRCYKNCQTGYTDMGLTCFKPADSLPTSSMTCKPGEELMLSNGRCIGDIVTETTTGTITETTTGTTTGTTGSQTTNSCSSDINDGLCNNEIVASNNLNRIILQDDGNLVQYNNLNQVKWATNTESKGASKLVMQSDGNLVLYNKDGATWASNTANKGVGPFQALLQDDGNFVVYSSTGPIWGNGVMNP